MPCNSTKKGKGKGKGKPKAYRFVIIAFILLFAVSADAEGLYRSSGEQSADAAITTTAGVLRGIMVATDATNAVTVSIYDHASAASGTELIPTTIITTSSTDRAQGVFLPFDVGFVNGIYVDITCSGTVAYVVYYRN